MVQPVLTKKHRETAVYWIKRFRDAVAEVEQSESPLHPLLRRATAEGYRSMADELEQEVKAYDARHAARPG